MKQPVITRDLERKAIYSDIIYDPEWLYVEVTIKEETGLYYSLHLYDCTYDIIVDWGDGCIEKNEYAHTYDKSGTYTIRIKGRIEYKKERTEFEGLFGMLEEMKAL